MTRSQRLRMLLLATASASLLVASSCDPKSPPTGSPLFTSPQTNPIALGRDGQRLYVANTTAGVVTAFDVSNPAAPVKAGEIRVGLDPVGLAVRPPGRDDVDATELLLVTNHISDSVSVVDTATLSVVQTLQELDADGVSLTNEPVGVTFAGPDRAFVTLDDPNEVLVVDFDAQDRASIAPTRLRITNQAPRALAVADGRLYVASFESFNQTELPTCAPGDPRGLSPGDPFDEGCEFTLDNAFIGSFAGNPNVGGRVILDRDQPDRDLFVFDAATLAPIDVVESVGTLLYGVATGSGGRVYVTHTEARNARNGLAELQNRMFENRLARIDCGPGGCGAPVQIDLDASAGEPVATPYGVAVSEDGALLVATASGSDGATPGASDGGVTAPLAGLVTLDADGAVLGTVAVGAIPQGVALRSDAAGQGTHAFVLNTVDSTLSVVDVSDPAQPSVVATLAAGPDPTPDDVRRGRIAFSTARASTSGTFSCESCHPGGNTDQLIWTINTIEGPDDGPFPGGVAPEPRTTMPVRGLRDTLPVHWDGSLADPFEGVFVPGDSAPDCDLEVDGQQGCMRHLVDASLGGVMCAQDFSSACVDGPSGLPGLLEDAERDDMAAFLLAVSFPPSPERRPDDALTPLGMQGVSDFFTFLDDPGSTGTCANTGGCHALPLTVDTNSGVGGFDAPSIRGLWDRSLIFSNGLMNSEEGLALLQDCADGVGPLDPCEATILPPSGEQVWDPAIGMTERGTLMGSFSPFFSNLYGVPAQGIWALVNEMSVGYPGLLGRQLELATADDDTAAANALEDAAVQGKIELLASLGQTGTWSFDPARGLWDGPTLGLTRSELVSLAQSTQQVITLTAHAPIAVEADTPQPLLWPDPPGSFPLIPVLNAGAAETFTVAQKYLTDGAVLLVNGSVCGGCSITLLPPAAPGEPELAEIFMDAAPPGAPPVALHVIQAQNPAGRVSNELPIAVLP
ncbi:MAG: hypothetical protein QNK05_22425 [Myxococcota bacterium]|nr:hypothetical protein [Myxococcota bacterium]